MRHKKLKLSGVLLLGLGLTSVQAQTMYVKESSGTQTDYSLSSIRKITFSGGNTIVQQSDNNTTSFALSEISYVRFTEDLVTSAKEQENKTFLMVYPNPVNDVLSIDLSGLEIKEGTLSLLSLDVSPLLTQQTQGTTTEIINLSELETGIYYCQFAYENEIKTVKIIKD